MALTTSLAALKYAEPQPLRLAHLAHWLEDRYIRQLSTEARGTLRAEQPAALRSYLEELGASADLLSALDAGGADERVGAWLLSLALHYEYGDKKDAHEKAAAAASAASSSSGEALLAADDAEVLALAAALGVTPGASATDTLQAVVKAARQRPRPAPPPAPPPLKRPALAPSASASASSSGATSARATRESRVPLAGLGAEAFPLGFETGGGEALDAAARVLRMLHVRRLRELQDGVNRAIVAMQEYTANPKTDSRLGRVGR